MQKLVKASSDAGARALEAATRDFTERLGKMDRTALELTDSIHQEAVHSKQRLRSAASAALLYRRNERFILQIV